MENKKNEESKDNQNLIYINNKSYNPDTKTCTFILHTHGNKDNKVEIELKEKQTLIKT